MLGWKLNDVSKRGYRVSHYQMDIGMVINRGRRERREGVRNNEAFLLLLFWHLNIGSYVSLRYTSNRNTEVLPWAIDVSSLEDMLLVLLHCPNKILNLRRKYLMWVVNIGRCIKRVKEVFVWVWYGLCHQVAKLCITLSESRKFHGSVTMCCTTCVINIRFPFVVFYCGSMFTYFKIAWWRHQTETFSALLAICAGNSPFPGEFPAQRPVTRSFDILFDMSLNKRLRKQWWGWWFETQSCPLWRHCNVNHMHCGNHTIVTVPVRLFWNK